MVAVVAYRLWRGPQTEARAALLVAVAVFSHWVLDFVVHRPDLPLYDNTAKVGLGLWNRPVLALGLEAALLLGSMALYLRGQRRGRGGLIIFGLVMLGIHVLAFFGPPPPSARVAAVTALVAYVGLAGIIAWWEHHGTVVPSVA